MALPGKRFRGLDELSDDGEPAFNIEATGWTFTIERGQVCMKRSHLSWLIPKIHGFQVVWDLAPGDETDELTAVYADFGYNGFDLAIRSLVEGTRCVGTTNPGVASYTLDEPIKWPIQADLCGAPA